MNQQNSLPVELIRYSKEFNKILSIATDAINRRYRPEYKKEYLYQVLSSIPIATTVSDDDIKQELYMIWLIGIKNYYISNPKCAVRKYLMRMSVWGLRDWLIKEANILMSAPVDENFDEEAECPFTLDLSFLLYGSSYPPLQELSNYERYLIYLKHVEDKHIIEIAKHLQKDRDLISKQITAIYNKLRGILNEVN